MPHVDEKNTRELMRVEEPKRVPAMRRSATRQAFDEAEEESRACRAGGAGAVGSLRNRGSAGGWLMMALFNESFLIFGTSESLKDQVPKVCIFFGRDQSVIYLFCLILQEEIGVTGVSDWFACHTRVGWFVAQFAAPFVSPTRKLFEENLA